MRSFVLDDGSRPRLEVAAVDAGALRRAVALGRCLCLGGAALGALALLGWVTGAMWLATLVPGHPTMMPNTALALLLVGAAKALRPAACEGGLRQALSVLAASIVLVIGAGTIVEYAFGVDLFLDRVLFVSEGGPYPGRPSPPTALALTLLGAALLLCDARPTARARPSEWLALSAGIVALTAMEGQILGAGALYRLHDAFVIGVSVPTAVGLLLLSMGLLLERPESGMVRLVISAGPAGALTRRLTLAVVLGPLLLGVVLTQLLAVQGVAEFALVYATLTVASTVVGLFLLHVTVVPLDRMYETLAASRARTQALIDQAADGIFVADLAGRYIDVNRAGCHMLGYAREEIIGKTLEELIPPGHSECVSHHKQRLLTGDAQVGEWTLRRKDGTDLPVEMSAIILRDGRWQWFVRDISERKNAQEVIRRSMERYELALRGADLGVWDWNITTGAVVFNLRWAEMRGFRLEEVNPHVDSWLSGIHPDDLPVVEKTLTDYLQGRIPEYESEHRVSTRAGGWIWTLDRGRVSARDAQGRPTRMAGTELDITARKRAEEALRLSEAKFSGIVAISADAIISIDEGQHITMFNEGAEKIFGYSRSEVIGAPLDLLLPEGLRARHRRHVEEFSTGSAVARQMEGRGPALVGLRKNGEEFAAEASISRLDTGSTRVLTVALRDVSEKRRRELANELLAEVGAVVGSSLDYEDTLARIAELAVRSFADACIVDVIQGCGEVQRLKVVSRDPANKWAWELLTQRPMDRRRPNLTSSVMKTRRTILLPRLSPEMIASLSQDEEQRRALRAADPQSIIAVPLMAHEKLLGVMAFVSSTPSRVYGAQDVHLAEELALRAALSIENALLYRATQRAVQARDDVLGIVVHDLRNPLGVILMQTGLVRCRPERGSQSAEVIERAAKRMNHLVKDLLDVTSMEAGQLSVERTRVAVAQVLADCVDAQRALASLASIELQIDAAVVPDISADRDRLLQVFENLLGNALKFTEAGGHVTVGAAPLAREVLLWVADTGAGIPAKDVAHVFDRFWQAQKAGRRGAGLGLTIVKGIVEAHGGRIWVESGLGRGSTFFFTIPTTSAAASDPSGPGFIAPLCQGRAIVRE